MSISGDRIERGVAACFPQPVSDEDMQEAQSLVEAIHYINCVHATGPLLPEIVYREGYPGYDLVNHVFRWDTRDYRDIFVNGFQAWPQGDTPDFAYYNLRDHVLHGRPIGNPDQDATPRAFVATTLSTSVPGLTNPVGTIVYRYEIYAPGGILAWQTLSPLLDRNYDLGEQDRNLLVRFRNQQEVSFVRGIARQYIRAAIPYRVTDQQYQGLAIVERYGTTMEENAYFNPQSHPQRTMSIMRPCLTYRNEYGMARNMTVEIYPPQAEARRQKREVAQCEAPSSAIIQWYAKGVAGYESYVDAAFRSSRTNEAYLFMYNEYVLVNYAPHGTGDKVLNGPILICDGFPSLAGTTFGEYGIDCAFGTHNGEEAFIFAGNLCAVVNYAPGTTDDKIIRGPMTISNMFPFFKGTTFERGIDSAFEATSKYEAYLFKGNEYALINYRTPTCIASRPIVQGFASLKNTIFESGIDAAFASHKYDEAYLFKGSQYALINFAPGTTDDYIIDGTAKDIIPNWPSLANILPRKNVGLDMHAHG